MLGIARHTAGAQGGRSDHGLSVISLKLTAKSGARDRNAETLINQQTREKWDGDNVRPVTQLSERTVPPKLVLRSFADLAALYSEAGK